MNHVRPLRLGSVALLASLTTIACGSDDPVGPQTPYATGGALSTGGVSGGGGVASGGVPGAGGTPVTGGSTGTGGLPASGGAQGTGGVTPASGGAQGSGGSAAGGGSSGGAQGSGGATSDRKPPCLQDPKHLVMIGDSYVNWITHTFPADMNAAAGVEIGNYAIGGTAMGSGGISLIPPQFETALQAHPKITAIIMDGGGNDILVADTVKFPAGGECRNKGAAATSIPDCQKIVQTALDAGRKLFIRMAEAGVQDAIYFFYPKVPSTWLGTDPNGMLDYSLPKIRQECENAYQTSIGVNPAKPIHCHFVDMVPVFQDHPEYFAREDLHPNPTGSKAMAAAVWAKMKTDCVAQPASSGCCAPN